MFATVANFQESCHQHRANKEGLNSLRLLNEIIAEFDQVSHISVMETLMMKVKYNLSVEIVLKSK